MKGFFKVIYNIIRGFVRLFFLILLMLAQGAIKLITYEPGTSKTITVRKAKRIRILSRFKVFILNAFPPAVNRYLGIENYKNYLNEHLRDGLQLCHK